MKIIKQFFLIVVVIMTTWSINAQTKIIRQGESGTMVTAEGEIFDIPEVASIITESKGNIVVENVLDVKMRPKEYESVDIKQGDVILMVNGKRVKTIAELKDTYASAEVGSAIKLGIQRNDEMMIASFAKADPEKLPKRRIVMRNGGDGGNENIMMLPYAGLIIGSKKDNVVIQGMIDNNTSVLKGADIKEGDIVTSINETKVSSFKDFSDTYKKIAVGEEVTIHTSRKEKELSFSFPKSESKEQRIIKRGN
jgi:S1-C subfamily serine protease